MTKVQKQLWIEALRSGKYKQGKGQLVKVTNGEASYCCLGVACELGLTKPEDKRNNCGFVKNNFLPNSVQQVLSYMNDGDEVINERYTLSKSFKEIADYIEREIPTED